MWELALFFLLILVVILSFFLKLEGLLWIAVILTTVTMGVVADIFRTSYLVDEVLVGYGQIAEMYVVSSFIFNHVPVYAFLMLALSIYRISPLLRKVIAIVGVLPILYDALHTPFIPAYEVNYGFVFWLWLLYVVIANLLIINKYLRTPKSVEKSHYLSLIFIYLPPPWLAIVTLVLPLYLYGAGGEWAYYRITLQLSVIIAFLVNLYYIIYPGFLGARLSSIRSKLESRVVASGVEIMNHSLKNEANKLLFMTSELKAADLNEVDRSQYINLIEQSAKEMSAMLEKLNLKTREATINLGVHTVQEVVDNVRDKSASLLHQYNLRLALDVHYHGTLRCDLQILSDDLFSLIDNAVHAVAKRVEPIIKIEVGVYGRYAAISVWDNGYGVSKENLSRLIEPYFTTKNKASSFGVGLYACYRNIAAQHGLMYIESEEGTWTKVSLYIRKGS